MGQPVSGTTTFASVHGPTIVSGSSTGSGLVATNVDGWDFTLLSSAATNCAIDAESDATKNLLKQTLDLDRVRQPKEQMLAAGCAV
jgi:hypothetical protein